MRISLSPEGNNSSHGGGEKKSNYTNKNPLNIEKGHDVLESSTSWKVILMKWNQLHHGIILEISRTLNPIVVVLGLRMDTTTLIIGA